MNKRALAPRNIRCWASPTRPSKPEISPALVCCLLIVFVVPPHPEGPAAILIPAFGHHIQIMVMEVEQFIPARVTRIGVENVTALVLIEHAVPLPFGRPRILNLVVKESLPL